MESEEIQERERKVLALFDRKWKTMTAKQIGLNTGLTEKQATYIVRKLVKRGKLEKERYGLPTSYSSDYRIKEA